MLKITLIKFCVQMLPYDADSINFSTEGMISLE